MKKILIGMCLMCVFASSFAFAQTDTSECNAENSVNIDSVVQNVAAGCCGSNKQNKCIKGNIKRLNKLKKSLTPPVVRRIVAGLKDLRSNNCSTVSANSCTEASSATLLEVFSTVDSKCCGLKFSSARKRCLKQQRKAWAKSSAFVPDNIISATKEEINDLVKSNQCGGAGVKSKCDVTRDNSDGGLGGWLHKPSGDHTSSPVNLLPSEDNASSCLYETKAGKFVTQLTYTGRANGNRQHFRVPGSPSCGSLPNNLVVRCSISGRQVCYNVPDPCNRYD